MKLHLRTPFNLRTLVEARPDPRELPSFFREAQDLAEAWERCPRADWMVEVLEMAIRSGLIQAPDPTSLRLFAVDCASRCGWSCFHTLEGAKRFLAGKASKEELAEIREQFSRGAAGAGICGLPRAEPAAAAQLAAHHTTDADAFDAARAASDFAVLFAGWQRARRHRGSSTLPGSAHPSFRVAALIAQRPHLAGPGRMQELAVQAERFRGILGNPFNGKPATIPQEEIDRLLAPAPPPREVRSWRPVPPPHKRPVIWDRYTPEKLAELHLTPREMEIICTIVRLRSTRKAVEELGLSRMHVGRVWNHARWIGEPTDSEYRKTAREKARRRTRGSAR